MLEEFVMLNVLEFEILNELTMQNVLFCVLETWKANLWEFLILNKRSTVCMQTKDKKRFKGSDILAKTKSFSLQCTCLKASTIVDAYH